MEEESEATKTEMDDVSIRLGRHHDVGCLQEESGATAAAPTATAGRAYGFAHGEPEHHDKGQSTTLTWQTSNATDVSIDGIGAVQPNGSQTSLRPIRRPTPWPRKERAGRRGHGASDGDCAAATASTAASATEEELFAQM